MTNDEYLLSRLPKRARLFGTHMFYPGKVVHVIIDDMLILTVFRMPAWKFKYVYIFQDGVIEPRPGWRMCSHVGLIDLDNTFYIRTRDEFIRDSWVEVYHDANGRNLSCVIYPLFFKRGVIVK